MYKTLTLDDLMGNEKYDYKVIEALRQGDFLVLKELSDTQKGDRDYMLPLLYAVRNDMHTYEVYKFCGETIQSDEELTLEVMSKEPKLIEGTPLTKNKEFVLKHINEYPAIKQCISQELKIDPVIESAIKQIDNGIRYGSETTQRTLELKEMFANDLELANDRKLVAEAIELDASLLKYASDELKNDYNFLMEESLKNKKIIDYVVYNSNDFGADGISAVRETSKEFTIDECLSIIEDMAETSSDARYKMVKEKVEKNGKEHPLTIKYVTAMIAQNDDLTPEAATNVLNYALLTMEKFKREESVDNKLPVNKENMEQLIGTTIINRLIQKAEGQGLELSDELKEKVDAYTSFYDEYSTLFREEKKSKREQEMHQIENTTTETEREALSIGSIEAVTSGVTLSEINKAIITVNTNMQKNMQKKYAGDEIETNQNIEDIEDIEK